MVGAERRQENDDSIACDDWRVGLWCMDALKTIMDPIMRHQRMSTNLGSCGALETLGDPAVVPKAWGLSGNMCYPGHVYSHLLLTLCKRLVCQGVVTDLDTINSRYCQPTNILCSRDGNHKEACVAYRYDFFTRHALWI